MRKLVVVILLIAAVSPLKGQTFAEDVSKWAEGWRMAFSDDGRKNWKPEFTFRNSTGFISGGPLITGGVRIDDKRTFSLGIGQAVTYFDAAPGYYYHIQTLFLMRRYFHLGKRDIVALYSDLGLGAAWIYKVEGKYRIDGTTGESIEMIHKSPGDVKFYASLEPGVRFRLYRNLHIFLGPTVATDRLGVHLGFGF